MAPVHRLSQAEDVPGCVRLVVGLAGEIWSGLEPGKGLSPGLHHVEVGACGLGRGISLCTWVRGWKIVCSGRPRPAPWLVPVLGPVGPE